MAASALVLALVLVLVLALVEVASPHQQGRPRRPAGSSSTAWRCHTNEEAWHQWERESRGLPDFFKGSSSPTASGTTLSTTGQQLALPMGVLLIEYDRGALIATGAAAATGHQHQQQQQQQQRGSLSLPSGLSPLQSYPSVWPQTNPITTRSLVRRRIRCSLRSQHSGRRSRCNRSSPVLLYLGIGKGAVDGVAFRPVHDTTHSNGHSKRCNAV